MDAPPIPTNEKTKVHLSRMEVLIGEFESNLICPLTLDLVVEPVIAEDDQVYGRENIEKWFSTLESKNRPITSPLTGLVMGKYLRPHEQLQTALDLLEQTSLQQQKLHNTPLPRIALDMIDSPLIKQMDNIKDKEWFKRLNLCMAQYVTLGNESHGKSSILERIIGAPLFPRDRTLCTCCVVRVRLRRGSDFKPAKVYIIDRDTSEIVPGSEVDLALENVCGEVRRKMKLIIAQEPGNLVSEKKEIIVEIEGRNCPNLNLVDLPGFVSSVVDASITQNVPQATFDLAKSVIAKEKDFSMFLAVLDCRVALNQTPLATLIKEHQIKDRVIGVLTKIDTYRPDDFYVDELMERLNFEGRSSNDHTFLGFPWMACSSRWTPPINVAPEQVRDIDRLRQIEREEQLLLETNKQFIHYCESTGRVGLKVIREKVQEIYDKFLAEKWLPVILGHMKRHITQLLMENALLGTPIADDSSYDGAMVEFTDAIKRYFKEDTIIKSRKPKVINAMLVKQVLKDRIDTFKYDLLHIEPSDCGARQLMRDFDALLMKNFVEELKTSTTHGAEEKQLAKETAIEILLNIASQLANHALVSVDAFPLIEMILEQDDATLQAVQNKPADFYLSNLFGTFVYDFYGTNFQIGRFPRLLEDFKAYVMENLTIRSEGFVVKAKAKIQRWQQDKPIIYEDYNRVTLKRECLKWSDGVFNYPNYIIDLWKDDLVQDIEGILTSYEPSSELYETEKCKDLRVQYITDITDLANEAINLDKFSLPK